ncbi:MAG: hypothetical protein PHW24_01985 [Candidatus Moranbacteria bacterium]|nr:hypothetical protein [Candidatus Moranbacteria bacterium]
MNKTEEIDWNKVPGVGSSKPKKKRKEIVSGLWEMYLYFCFILFFIITVNVFGGDFSYVRSATAIRFWIVFFTPCIVYLIYKLNESRGFEKIAHDYDDLIPQYEFLKYEFLNRENEWQKATGDITDLSLFELDEIKNLSKLKSEIRKIANRIPKIEDEREKRISYSDEERAYSDEYFLNLRKLLGMKYGDNKYDKKIEELD